MQRGTYPERIEVHIRLHSKPNIVDSNVVDLRCGRSSPVFDLLDITAEGKLKW